MAAANNTRAAFFAVITPYLEKIYENAPQFGSAGILLTFHAGDITRIDISETVQQKPAPRTDGQRGAQ